MNAHHALGYAAAITSVVIALVFGAIQTSFLRWVDFLLYSLAVILSIVAVLLVVYALVQRFGKQPEPEQPESRHPLFSVRLPEHPRRGQIDNYKTVRFDKVLITKRSEGDRVLRFHPSMLDREFVDVGEFQRIYQDRPGIHSGYHSNPLDLPNNTQKVLAFVLASGSEGAVDTFELSVHDVQSRHSFIISTLGEHVCYDDGSVELDMHDPVSLVSQKREGARAWADLESGLAEIMRDENTAYEEVDRDTQERGVYRSGIRTAGYVAVAEEHDRLRESAVRDWTRRLEDAGFDNVPEPPNSSAIRPSTFSDDEHRFDRNWSGRDPIFCGCGRLAYVASDGQGEAWWCPEHEYQVS